MGEIKHLLPQKKYYKTNLHTHSNISDGHLSPEEVKEQYKAKGYSIVALSDHNIVTNQQHLNDADFLFLSAAEMDIASKKFRGKSLHIGFIYRDPKLLWVPFRGIEDALPHMIPYIEKCDSSDLTRECNTKALNAIIASAKEKGCLVIFNHPEWCLFHAEDYLPLKGLWGVEYRNSTCAVKYGIDNANEQIYRELQYAHPDIVPVMADDMHRPDSLGMSWNMVGADELTYDAVMDALERKDLYASCGPELQEITWDGTTLNVKCSPAASVQCIANRRSGCKIEHAADGNLLTDISFDLSKWARFIDGENGRSIRVIVTAPDGTYAVSRTYTAKDF